MNRVIRMMLNQGFLKILFLPMNIFCQTVGDANFRPLFLSLAFACYPPTLVYSFLMRASITKKTTVSDNLKNSFLKPEVEEQYQPTIKL